MVLIFSTKKKKASKLCHGNLISHIKNYIGYISRLILYNFTRVHDSNIDGGRISKLVYRFLPNIVID